MQRIEISLIALLLSAFLSSPAFAAIASVGDITANTCTATTSGTTLACTTNATAEVGNVLIVYIGANNVGTTDADHSEVSSVVDSASNSYSKLCEFTNGQGSAAAGATVSLWYTRVTSQLTSGGTFTVNFANSIASRAANAWEFTVGAALEVVGSCQSTAADATTTVGSLAISGLSPNAETLFFRAIATETNSNANLSVTTNYTIAGDVVADAGTTATSMKTEGEFRIEANSDGDTSNPSGAAANDNASVFVALREVVAAAPIGPLRRRNQ